MSACATAATAARVLSQLRRDPRTVALLLAVPCVLMVLLKGVLRGRLGGFQHVGPPLLGLFPLISMFLVTSITVLRERTSGTLERLMTLPLAKADLLAGYAVAFSAVAVIARLARAGPVGSRLALDVAVTLGATVLALALGAATLRRRTA